MESCFGQMANFIKDTGKKGPNMEKESLKALMELRNMVSGLKENELFLKKAKKIDLMSIPITSFSGLET